MIRLRRRHVEQPDAKTDPIILLNLSLFIMLLAFFMVLNAVSSFEEYKYRPIIKNVRDTFSSSVIRDDEGPSETAANVQSIREGQVIDRIDALFNAQITGFDATRSASSGVMQVDIPFGEFDRAVKAMGQVDLTKQEAVTGLQTYFLPTLVSLLQEEEQGRAYRMDMVFYTRDNPPLLMNSDPAVLQETMRQAASYPPLFEQAGLPRHLMDIGVRRGNPAMVTVIFRPRAVYTPVKKNGGSND